MKRKTAPKSNEQIHKIITDKLIEKIKSGKLNWKKGWNPALGMPCNYISKNPYRGFNMLITMFDDYSSNYYVTEKQISDLGGKLKEGEKGNYTPITYWNLKQISIAVKDEETGEVIKYKRKTIPCLRFFQLYNAEQTEGIEFKKMELNDFGTIDYIEKTVENMPEKPQIKNGKGSAYYSPSFDYIGMPEKGTFHSLEKYYSTLFHELIHSTGHTSRLNRATVMGGIFKSHDQYSFEELIAEFGAAFLNANFGIATTASEENSAAYLQSWAKKLKEDPRLLYKAAGSAQKALDYILSRVKIDNVPQESQEKQYIKAA